MSRATILEAIRRTLIAGDVKAALKLIDDERGRDGRLLDFDFVARDVDGEARLVTFWASSQAEALKNARSWGRRSPLGYEIEAVERDEAA